MPGPSNPHQSPLPLSIGVEQTDAAGFLKAPQQSVMALIHHLRRTPPGQPRRDHHHSRQQNHAPNMHDAKTHAQSSERDPHSPSASNSLCDSSSESTTMLDATASSLYMSIIRRRSRQLIFKVPAGLCVVSRTFRESFQESRTVPENVAKNVPDVWCYSGSTRIHTSACSTWLLPRGCIHGSLDENGSRCSKVLQHQ